MRFVWLAVTLTMVIEGAFSGEARLREPESLNYGQRHELFSSILNEKRVIDIYVPESHDLTHEERVYPVMFVFTPKFSRVTASVIDHLSSEDRLPDCIVVSFANGRNYGPNLHANGMWGPNRKMLEFNADPAKFARFIKEELLPYLGKRYRIADFRMAIGASGSSVFTMHSFAKEPDLFQGHIIIAAGDMLGMGYQEGRTFIDAYETHLRQSPDRKGYLHISSAESDAPEGSEARNNLIELEKRLKPFENQNLLIRSAIIPNETHYASWLTGLKAGLELMFPVADWAPDYRAFDEPKGQVLKRVDAFYSGLSKKYGFTILPRGYLWNSGNCMAGTGRRLMRIGRNAEAVEVYRRWVVYRPRSAYALSSLATALDADNRLEEAIAMQKQAVMLGRQYDTNYLTEYEDGLKKLKSKLSK